ncbi:MAG: transcription termination/antitermination protein NusG [Verrucomicrobiota bacterium]
MNEEANMDSVDAMGNDTLGTDSSKGQWFAVHVLSGQEENVKKHMISRMKMEEMEEDVHAIVIPTERISEVKRGKKTEAERKLYPGYVFVNLNLLDEEKKMVERSWYFIRETPGVIGFADGEHPIPMRQKEVDGMLAQMREKEDKVVPKILFELNDRVRVGDGPFEGQEGVIEEIDEERGRVRVAVSIFGRSTPVDLEYWQVEKL